MKIAGKGWVAAIALGLAICPGLAIAAQSEVAEQSARARTLQIEVHTLDRHLERNTSTLDQAIGDARRHGLTDRVGRLEARRRLLGETLLNTERISVTRAQVRAGQEHLRDAEFEQAVAAFDSARTRLHGLLVDFAAAEYLLMIEPVVADLRQRWLSRDPDTDDGIASEVEEGFQHAAGLRAHGELGAALHAYRMLAQDYRELLRPWE